MIIIRHFCEFIVINFSELFRLNIDLNNNKPAIDTDSNFRHFAKSVKKILFIASIDLLPRCIFWSCSNVAICSRMYFIVPLT